ncbi:WXG100 family type VII secretion target [Actinophytocola sediminis]
MRTTDDTASKQGGTGAVASAQALRDTVDGGGWIASGLNVEAGLTALSATMRPVDAVAKAGLPWLTPKVQPLQEVLDRLAGNASVLRTFADAWQRVSPTVEQVGQQLTRTSSATAGQWQGVAGDRYRGRAAEIADVLHGSATTFAALSAVATRMGEVVAGARTQVNELITDLVNRLVSYVGQATAAEGGVTSNVMAQATSMVSSYTGPIADIESKLAQTVSNLEPLLTGNNTTGDTRGITKDSGVQYAYLHPDHRNPMSKHERILESGGGGGGSAGVSLAALLAWLRKLLLGESKAIPPATPPGQQPGDTPTATPPGTPSNPDTSPATPPVPQPGTPPIQQPGTPETLPRPGDTPPARQPEAPAVQEPGTPPRQQPATPAIPPPGDTPGQQPGTPPTPRPGTPETTPPQTPQEGSPPQMADPPAKDQPEPPAPKISDEERRRQEDLAWGGLEESTPQPLDDDEIDQRFRQNSDGVVPSQERPAQVVGEDWVVRNTVSSEKELLEKLGVPGASVEHLGRTKDEKLIAQGFTEAYQVLDKNEIYRTFFSNKAGTRLTFPHGSSAND